MQFNCVKKKLNWTFSGTAGVSHQVCQFFFVSSVCLFVRVTMVVTLCTNRFHIQQLYVLPTLYLCVLFIWEQTATCATYSINWMVFITEMKSAYSAVRTGSLNKAVCASSVMGYYSTLLGPQVPQVHLITFRKWLCFSTTSFCSSLFARRLLLVPKHAVVFLV